MTSLENIQIILGVIVTIVGAIITHLAGYKFYQFKIRSVFKKVNELERRINLHDRELMPKSELNDLMKDLKMDIRDVRDQVHSLVVALAKNP